MLQHHRIRVPARSSTASSVPKLAQTVPLRAAGPASAHARLHVVVCAAPRARHRLIPHAACAIALHSFSFFTPLPDSWAPVLPCHSSARTHVLALLAPPYSLRHLRAHAPVLQHLPRLRQLGSASAPPTWSHGRACRSGLACACASASPPALAPVRVLPEPGSAPPEPPCTGSLPCASTPPARAPSAVLARPPEPGATRSPCRLAAAARRPALSSAHRRAPAPRSPPHTVVHLRPSRPALRAPAPEPHVLLRCLGPLATAGS
jgi:hypothetical protein